MRTGCSDVQPLYVEGTGQNSFPLLRKVLVNYGDRVGYADTLEEALDQVFGAGAGQSATDGGDAPPGDEGTATPTTPSAPTSPPADGGGTSSSPEMAAAAADISEAIEALKNAQRSGDFEGQGRALADLETAVAAYQAAQRAAGSSATPADATPTG